MKLHTGWCTQTNTQLLGRVRRRWRRLYNTWNGRERPPFHGQAFVLILLGEEPARAHVHVVSVGAASFEGRRKREGKGKGTYSSRGTRPVKCVAGGNVTSWERCEHCTWLNMSSFGLMFCRSKYESTAATTSPYEDVTFKKLPDWLL